MKRRVDPEPSISTTYGGCNSYDRDLMVAMNVYTLQDMKSGAHYYKVLKILQRGANPNTQPDVPGPTALIACVKHPVEYFDLAVARLLLEWGADPNATLYGYNAVGWLGICNNTEGVTALRAAINEYCPGLYSREEVANFHPSAKRSNHFR